MARVVLNPRAPKRIREVDYRTYSQGDAARSAELTRWYENGDLIILKSYRFAAGGDVFHHVPFPSKLGQTKLFLHFDPVRHGMPVREDYWAAARESVAKTHITQEQFEDAIRQANDELLTLSDRLFPYYEYSRRLCLYNFSEMLAHNLHFDSPKHAGDQTQLRVFVNVDNSPRIWRIGGALEDMAGDCYRSAGLRETMDQHARMFSRRTTHASFGDRYESGAHPYPMHSIVFQPGDVWFLNPNMLAHEVVYGRRILDGVFLFEESGLRNPKRYYPNIIDRLHRKHLGPLGYWLEKRKAKRAAAG